MMQVCKKQIKKLSPLGITINVNGLNSSIRIPKMQNAIYIYIYRFKMDKQFHLLFVVMFMRSQSTENDVPNFRQGMRRTDLEKYTKGMST